jgi:transcription elongation factor Elf1
MIEEKKYLQRVKKFTCDECGSNAGVRPYNRNGKRYLICENCSWKPWKELKFKNKLSSVP